MDSGNRRRSSVDDAVPARRLASTDALQPTGRSWQGRVVAGALIHRPE